MNALRRDIEENEIVVIKASVLLPEFSLIERRLFVVDGGFGMKNATLGQSCFGFFLEDGPAAHFRCRQPGTHISREETEQYQKENPKFWEA